MGDVIEEEEKEEEEDMRHHRGVGELEVWWISSREISREAYKISLLCGS